jgi:hypothetical protein
MWMHVLPAHSDPHGDHVAGKAAVNVVTAAEFGQLKPASEVGKWAVAMSTTRAAGQTMPAAPKAVVQFSMADERSRMDARGEVEPAIWRVLEVERAGRKGRMVAALVDALGEAAREQTRKHVSALMAFQFVKAAKPSELARLKAVSGSLGGSTAARSVSVEGAVTLLAVVMRAGFPEFDWAPVWELAHLIGRMLTLEGESATRRASLVYDWAMRQLQEAGRAARDDTSSGALALLDGAAFEVALKKRVATSIESYDEHQADMAELRAVAAGAGSPAGTPTGGRAPPPGGATAAPWATGVSAAHLNRDWTSRACASRAWAHAVAESPLPLFF